MIQEHQDLIDFIYKNINNRNKNFWISYTDSVAWKLIKLNNFNMEFNLIGPIYWIYHWSKPYGNIETKEKVSEEYANVQYNNALVWLKNGLRKIVNGN